MRLRPVNDLVIAFIDYPACLWSQSFVHPGGCAPGLPVDPVAENDYAGGNRSTPARLQSRRATGPAGPVARYHVL